MNAIDVCAFRFRYRGEQAPVLGNTERGLSLSIGRGERCLLVGRNGAGKTTLLSVLAGKHMVAEAEVRVLGSPAFFDTSLVKRVSFIGGAFPLDVDVRVDEILSRARDATPGRPERMERLIEVLDIDRRWRMNRVSDGQRRRVQILLGLLRPCELLLLDEVTTDLDVIARADLLRFLREECETRGTTILYATHILDGLDAWATHLAFLDGGVVSVHAPLSEIAELSSLRASQNASPLLRLVEGWLRGAVPRVP